MEEHVDKVCGGTAIIQSSKTVPLSLCLEGHLHLLFLINVAKDKICPNPLLVVSHLHVNIALEPAELAVFVLCLIFLRNAGNSLALELQKIFPRKNTSKTFLIILIHLIVDI